MKKSISILWLSASLCLFILACGGNKFEVDTSKIDVQIDIKRLDKDKLEKILPPILIVITLVMGTMVIFK